MRVALLAGTLGRGGAEKQLVYMARALDQAGVAVQTYCLERGGFFEPALHALDLAPVWIGRRAAPPARLATFVAALRRFRPHIVQCLHPYANIYVTAVAALYRAISIGGIRSDVWHELESNGPWGKWLLRMPAALITNSYAAKRNAEALGLRSTGIHVVPNVVDVSEFDAHWHQVATTPRIGPPVVATVASLFPVKRLERFLSALAVARQAVTDLRGIVAGEGPEKEHLLRIAGNLGLLPDGVRFLGGCDATSVLTQADMMVLTSDHEGFPNALVEAMAAALPVVTTPAGDAGVVVEHGVTGYVVPFDDVTAMAECLVRLARSPDLRRVLGAAGRHRAERDYRFEHLGGRLLGTYRLIAEEQRHRQVLQALSTVDT